VFSRSAFFLSKPSTVVDASVAFKMAATLTRGLSGIMFIFLKCHKFIAKMKASFYGLLKLVCIGKPV